MSKEDSINRSLSVGASSPSLIGEGWQRRVPLTGRGCGRPYAATIGTFDGVHRGHCYLLRQLRERAAERGLQTLALTFRQHPALTLGYPAPPALSLLADKVEHLCREVDAVEVLDFTAEMAHLTAREFMQHLRDHYGVRLLLLGHDHHFGRPTPDDDYERDARELDIELIRALPLAVDADNPSRGTISSSAIRRALMEGRLDEANEALGRPYTLSGTVVRGHQVGRTLGFPTANLRCEQLLPLAGVYAVEVANTAVADGASALPALLNIGHRPTVQNGNDLSVEVHIPGFSGDLYGQTLSVTLLRRLRDEQQFPSLEALRGQIAQDIKEIRIKK